MTILERHTTGPAPAHAMKERWDFFARTDPMFHILGLRDGCSTQEFLSSGKDVVGDCLAWAGGLAPRRRGRMLEIGCGLGRTAHHFASEFEQVDAVDVSPSMIRQARELGPPANVRFSEVRGADLGAFENGAFQFVFSYLVFQHIPDEHAIRSYLDEIARVLAPDGVAAIQFDTRPLSWGVALYKALPDALLPRNHRRFMRRYRRSSASIRRMADDAGLRILGERAPDTSDHFFLFGGRNARLTP